MGENYSNNTWNSDKKKSAEIEILHTVKFHLRDNIEYMLDMNDINTKTFWKNLEETIARDNFKNSHLKTFLLPAPNQ